MSDQMRTVFFINHAGGGYASHKTVEGGTTLASFFAANVGGDAKNYQIRVNRDVQPEDYILQDKDRVTITPVKIEGALSH